MNDLRNVWGCVVLVALGGCVSPSASDSGIPRKQASPEIADRLVPGSTATRSMSVSINEFSGFLFVIRSQHQVLKPTLRLGNSSSVGAGSKTAGGLEVQLARVLPLEIPRFPGWHIRSIPPAQRNHQPNDILVPLSAPRGAMPSRLEPNIDHVFWAEVYAPKGVSAGKRIVELSLHAAEKRVGGLNIEVTVWPMVLPDQAEFSAIGEVDISGLLGHHFSELAPARSASWQEHPKAEQYRQMLMATLRLVQTHRVMPTLRDLHPRVKVAPRGSLEVDWSHYDRLAGPLLDGAAFDNRSPMPVWPLPVEGILDPNAGTLAPPSSQFSREYLEECARHFEQNGWLSQAYVSIDSAGQPTAESLSDATVAANLVHSVRKELKTASHFFPQNMGPYGWFDFPEHSLGDGVDVWITEAQFFDPVKMNAQRSKGKRTWLAVDRPPFSGSISSVARPADILALSWQAAALGAENLWIGCVNCWPEPVQQSRSQPPMQCGPDALLCPGTPLGLSEPVPTLRLKRLRASMQLAAYAKMLGEHGKTEMVQKLRTQLVAHAGTGAYRAHFADGRNIGWAEDVEEYELARLIMAKEMLRSVSPSAEAEEPGLSLDMLWQRFMGLTNKIEMRVDGGRVRPKGSARMEVEAWLSFSSRGQAGSDGMVSLVGLPTGCTANEESHTVHLRNGKPTRTSLIFDCDFTFLASGAPLEPILEFRQGDLRRFRTPARISLIVAEPVANPPTIDGDLSDWGVGAGNVASDFRLIAGTCDEMEGCDKPTLRAYAFARRDRDYLYIGTNVESAPAAPAGSRRKSIAYDDWIPMEDEDLVEILIDPLNAGTRIPSDLYHLVVKRSGVYLVERGISTTPPVGPRRPWLAEIEVASRDHGSRWIAEVRIPLASFERAGPVRGEIWGFNVTHYNAAQQEFSTWSGATQNAYDPLSLGNLLLP